MATDADALPRIDKRYGEKCAALLWQLQQQNESQEQQSTAATRKTALAVKCGITVPKSAGYRGSATPAAAVTGSTALSTMKQQRPSSTRAVAKKSNANLEHASQATRVRFSSSRAFNSSVEDDRAQFQQLEAANSGPIQAFTSPRSSGDRNRCALRGLAWWSCGSDRCLTSLKWLDSRYVERSLTDLDVVHDENENLRLEIAVLHEKLMEKYVGIFPSFFFETSTLSVSRVQQTL